MAWAWACRVAKSVKRAVIAIKLIRLQPIEGAATIFFNFSLQLQIGKTAYTNIGYAGQHDSSNKRLDFVNVIFRISPLLPRQFALL